MQALAIPVLATYGEEEQFELQPEEQAEEYPLIALRNMSVFPGTLVPILIGRKKSMQVVRLAEKENRCFGVVTQRDANVEDPGLEDLYAVGTIVEVSQIMELPSGEVSVILRGRQRFTLTSLTQYNPYLSGRVELLSEELPADRTEFDILTELIHDRLLHLFERLAPEPPKGFRETIRGLKNRIYVLHLAASLLSFSMEERQKLLEENSLYERGVEILRQLNDQIVESEIREEILGRTRREMDQQQREYFLQQQMRSIQDELGGGATSDEEIDELRKKGKEKLWSEAVAETFEKELRKAERLNPQSPDFSIQMQYLRTIVELPWGVYSQDNFDLKGAKETLDREHYGLDRVKERILEHLAVLKLKGDMKSPILCLYGPPGVGKTSLGRSIAESLGRKYVRISLGGVHDEAEIRGHRRTYIGAMSGRIIQSLQKAGTSNPVFVLDEIDKLSSDYKGDPASALLEVLDPEQNTTFHDNYLDIDYDLSKVLFIATANNISTIPQALRDRMELIEVTGYIAEEKLKIAEQYLVPKEAKEHGLKLEDLHFAPGALDLIIEEYTRESGVRTLTKQIAAVMRKLAWAMASEEALPSEITPELVREYLGKTIYSRDKYQGNEHPGVVVGLAWTSVGGEILFIESSLQPGQNGKLILTGSLGDVMKESATIALSYIRAHATELGIDLDQIKDKEIHIHVPEGAIPKDGPSAGITMVTSLVSGITDIILCRENEKDIQEINVHYLEGLSFHYVDEITEVLDFALLDEVVDKAK